MAGKLSVYEPTARKNWAWNPSSEYNAASWTVVRGSTLTRSFDRATRGCASLKVAPVSDAAGSGVSQTTATGMGQTVGTVITVGCDLWIVTGQVRATVTLYYTVGSLVSNTTTHTTTGQWLHYTQALTVESGKTLDRVEIVLINQNNAAGNIFYVDALQIEEGAETSYIDGDQGGCVWDGDRGGSTSSRSGQYRGGGTLRDIDSYCGITTSAVVGLGAMPHTLLQRGYSTIPGGLVDGFRQEMRETSLVGGYSAANLAGMHAVRKKLNALLLPDRYYPSNQPLRFRYTGAAIPVEYEAWYRDGLVGSLDARDGRYERLALSFTSPDPFLRETGAPSFSKVDAGSYSATLAYFIKRVSGTWQNAADITAATIKINCLYRYTGGWLVGGSFTTLDGVTNATNIAKISDAGVVTAIGTGANGEVFRFWNHFDTNTVVVMGAFTSCNGVANTAGICKLSTSGWTFTHLGNGVASGGVVYDAWSRGTTQDLFIAGNFSSANGATPVSNTKHICKYGMGGANWVALHNGTVNANSGNGPYATCVKGSTTDIYPRYVWWGGYFGQVSSATCSNLIRFNTEDNTWSSPGSVAPAAGKPLTIAYMGSGTFVVGGDGITSVGGVTCYNVAKRSGSGSWSAMAPGFGGGLVRHLYYLSGKLWAVGAFTDGGSYTLGGLNGIAYHDGAWHNYDAGLPSGDKAQDIVFYGGDPYVGLNGTVASWASGANVTITNSGTSPAYPRIAFPWISGSSVAPVVKSITNVTTGQQINLEYALYQDDILVVDLDYQSDPITSPVRSRKRVYSILGGDVPEALRSGSDLAEFCLVPGANVLSFYVKEDASCVNAPQALVIFPNTHDSADV